MDIGGSERHTRFQFDRLEEWKREEILKKQREQARLREALAEQVREKKLREEASLNQREEDWHRDRDGKSLTVVLSARDRQKTQDLIREETTSLPTASNNNDSEHHHDSASDSFSKKFQWKQDAILEKQRKQREMRALLEEQINYKKREAGEKNHETRTPSNTLQHTTTSPLVSRRSSHLEESRRKMLGTSLEETVQPGDDLGEDFAKLFPWKQEAILKKRREQERTRRMLAEQLELKQQAAGKESADPCQTFDGSKSGESIDLEGGSNSASIKDIVENLHGKDHDVQPSSREDTRYREEIEELKEQVEEQKRLLREQAELMQDLQRRTEHSRPDSPQVEVELAQGAKQKPRGHVPSRGSRKRRDGRRKAKEDKEASTSRRTTSRLSMTSKTSADAPQVRECSLKRNNAGKLCVEVEPVLDTFCVIKRVGKSFSQDDRRHLREGDLICALGSFNCKRLIKSLGDRVCEREDLLRTLIFEFPPPSFDDVRKTFTKAGALVTFAVFNCSKDEIIDLMEREEGAWGAADPEDDNTMDQLQHDAAEVQDHSSPSFSGRLEQEEEQEQEQEFEPLVEKGSLVEKDVDGQLSGSSKFVYSDQWDSLPF